MESAALGSSHMCLCHAFDYGHYFVLRHIEFWKEERKPHRVQSRSSRTGHRSPQVKYVRCLQQVQISHPLVSETIALTFDPFLLDRSDSSKFKGLQYMPRALVEITTILLFVSLLARTNAHTVSHTATHSTSNADISLLVCLSSATVTTRSSASQHSELPGHHQKERNASKSDKAQCSFCGFSETRPSLSPTHICTITNRCPKIPSQPAYRKLALRPSVYYSNFSVTTSGSVTLHFLNSISSTHVPKHSGQKPMQMLGRWMGAGEGQKHWNALTPVHLCAQAFPTKAQLWETITSVTLLWLYCCIIRWCCHHLIAQALRLHLSHIKWGEFKAFKMQNCQTATFLKLHCNCNEKMYRFILFTSVRHIQSFRACKATHLWGKRSAGKAPLHFKPQQTRPSSAALGYCHYLISGPGFHKPNRKVCQAVKWREQNSASGREKKHTLETFHCGTQCTQEFKVSPIKASKNVLL